MSITTALGLLAVLAVALVIVKLAGLLRMSQTEIDADEQRLREKGNIFIQKR